MPGMPEAQAHMAHCIGTPPTVPAQTLLGFDYGSQRIGVAVGQRITGTASALTTLAARDGQPDWQQVSKLLDTWQPQALVVGQPLQLDGSRSASTEAAERFARRLEGRFRLPVYLCDERLSSHAAEHWGAAPDKRGGLDAAAAQIILQDWLDSHGEQ